MRYPGPHSQVLATIDRLQADTAYPALQPVIDYGVAQDYWFFESEECNRPPIWRRFPDWENTLEQRPELPCLTAWLELPSHFVLMLGSDAIWFYHTVRWAIFLHDSVWQALLLEAIRHFAETFGAPECIITRDEHPAIQAFCGGATYSDALRASTQPSEGEVAGIENLSIDRGIAENLVFAGPDGYEAVPMWESKGYLRIIF